MRHEVCQPIADGRVLLSIALRPLRLGSLLTACVLFAGVAFASPPPPAETAPPTHLRPVQSKADCTTLTLAAFVCDAGGRAGNAGWSKHHHKVVIVLHDVERMLVAWMADLGYEVQFK